MSDIPPYYIDISGVFNIQKNLVQTLPGDNNPESQKVLGNVAGSLNSLYNSFVNTGVTTLGTLDHQQDMLKIVNTEYDRLNKKKEDIDSAIIGKQRALELNESYRLRYRHYMKMLMVVIVCILLVLLFSNLSTWFPVVPSWVFEFLSILTVSSGIVIIYYMFLDLISRNNVDYNEMKTSPINTDGNVYVRQFDQGDLMGGLNMNMCIGSSCCNDGTHWDETSAVCIGNTVSGFTTIHGNQDLVKANNPTEIVNYSFLQ